MSSDKNKVPNLPDGWVLCKSKSSPGKTYYFNKKTGKSIWTQPQIDLKSLDKKPSTNKDSKKDKYKKQEKRKKEEPFKKTNKRKSNHEEEIPPNKRLKEESPVKRDKIANSISPSMAFKTDSPEQSSSRASVSASPNKKVETLLHKNHQSHKQKLSKNIANTRLSNLRSRLSAEAEEERQLELRKEKNADKEYEPQSKKMNISSKAGPCDISHKIKEKSPTVNESKLNQSPNSESNPSPSQFLAANKIISSMKAQLPDEYYNIKQKDTFADIEKGICSQTPEYPTLKHPATPPQFSEASKLMNAIKSKLTYKSPLKDGNRISLEKFKHNLNALNDDTTNDFLDKSIEFNNSVVEAMEVEETKEVSQTPSQMKRDESTVGSDLVLVVDTNIFIHELDFIEKLSDTYIKGYSEKPILLVPWRVINELDRLKDNNNGNGPLCKRAKAAMNYLYQSLPENRHISGQPLRDANSHIYPCEIPDDEILNCALQQVERGKSVLLISNDKNLCNKAAINNVKYMSVSELKKLLVSKSQTTQPDSVSDIKHYKQTMYQLLANILENEMREKYNNLWQHVLFKAPPWTLVDVLQCLLKHWRAVFSDVFPRIEPLITDLKNYLMSIEKKDDTKITENDATTFKDLCLDVAKRCQIIPEYMELAKRTVDGLLRGCANETDCSKRGLTSETDSAQLVNETDSSSHGRVSEIGGGDSNSIVQTFEALWTVMSSYCGQVCSSVGVPHGMSAQAAPAGARWPDLTAHLRGLSAAIHGVLSADGSSVEDHIQRLESAFNSAAAAVCGERSVNRDQLRIFCTNNRNMLQEAYTKFSELVDLLNVCKNRLSSMN